jgi:hypothetical protein
MQYAPTTQIAIDMGELCHERSDMRVTRGVPDSHDRETHRHVPAAVIRSGGGRLQLTA